MSKSFLVLFFKKEPLSFCGRKVVDGRFRGHDGVGLWVDVGHLA
jgi:hypothetical protein